VRVARGATLRANAVIDQDVTPRPAQRRVAPPPGPCAPAAPAPAPPHLAARRPDPLAGLLARAVDRRAAPLLQRRPSSVKTSGGTFNATQYEALQPLVGEDHVGAQISLEFVPSLPVEGRIGLIQSVMYGGTSKIDAPVKLRARPKGSQGAFEELVVGQSPVYAALRDPTVTPPAHVRLADTTDPRDVVAKWETSAHQGSGTTSEAVAAHASDYTSKRGKAAIPLTGRNQTGEARGGKVTPASLTDRPGFAADQPHASKVVSWHAETAAIVLDGPMEGTYLGSIRWGWESQPVKDGVPKVRLDPEEIELTGEGLPSVAFLQAGLGWNRTREATDVTGTYALIPVPLPKSQTTLRQPSRFEHWQLADHDAKDLLEAHAFVMGLAPKGLLVDPQLRFFAERLVGALDAKGETTAASGLREQVDFVKDRL
jgi:hypothetical protein